MGGGCSRGCQGSSGLSAPSGFPCQAFPGEAAGWQPGRTAGCGEAVKSNLYGSFAGLRVMDVPRRWRVTEMFYRIKDTGGALIDVAGRDRKGINSPSNVGKPPEPLTIRRRGGSCSLCFPSSRIKDV